jgi:hypothetical protein
VEANTQYNYVYYKLVAEEWFNPILW